MQPRSACVRRSTAASAGTAAGCHPAASTRSPWSVWAHEQLDGHLQQRGRDEQRQRGDACAGCGQARVRGSGQVADGQSGGARCKLPGCLAGHRASARQHSSANPGPSVPSRTAGEQGAPMSSRRTRPAQHATTTQNSFTALRARRTHEQQVDGFIQQVPLVRARQQHKHKLANLLGGGGWAGGRVWTRGGWGGGGWTRHASRAAHTQARRLGLHHGWVGGWVAGG